MDVVVNELQQKPHDISQDEGGNQVPVDDVSQTANTPVSQVQQETRFTLSFDGDQRNNRNRKAKEHSQHMKQIKIVASADTEAR